MIKIALIRIACLLTILFCNPAQAWYDNQWRYRVPINVPSTAKIGSTIKANVDFAALLTSLGATGTFDINSPRVVRSDDVSLVSTQEFTDRIYNGATDALSNSRGEVRFILQDNGAATYYLYFDITANGSKAVNPQTKINGNFEADTTGTLVPTGWLSATRTYTSTDLQIRSSETVTVTESSGRPNSVATDGTPNSGGFSYLMGFRTNSDGSAGTGVRAVLTRDIVIPASNPGSFKINFKPQGWDSAEDDDLSAYDYLQVRLLNPSNSSVLLNVVGPQMENYRDCPYSPNYGLNAASTDVPGYGYYNYWDNETDRDNHEEGLSSQFNRGLQPWVSCSASLSSLAGRTVRLEIRIFVTSQYKSWFLLDDVEWSVIDASLGSAQILVEDTPPSSFNAFETSTASAAVDGVLKTKIAGTAFGFDVVALSGTPSVLTSFTGSIKVELVDGSDTASCSARSAIQTVAATYTYTSGDQGRHTFSGILQNQAYPNVMVRLSYPATSSTLVVCATDRFAIRPANFVAVATDSSWLAAGTTRTLNASTASGTPVHKSGAPFTLTITAYNASGNVTTGYNSTPTISSLNCVLPASACSLGVMSSGAFTLAGGIATSITSQYSEVGAISAIVSDSNFAAIDATDGSTSTERTISSTAFTVGRFVPDHFRVSQNTPSFTPGCGSFSYIGQPLRYATQPVATVTAENASGSVTQNYKGTLWKIVSSSLTPGYAAAGQALTVLNANLPGVVDNSNGTGTLSFADTTSNILSFTRADPVAEFNAEIAMSFTLQDADGVAAISNPVSFGVASAGNGIAFTGGNKPMRWGRLVMQNAYGSELLPLALPLSSEYFNGSSFIPNTADQCTSLTLNSQLQLSNPAIASGSAQPGNTAMTLGAGTATATLANSPFLAGSAGLSFSAPGSGNTGYIDITGSISSLPWLLFDWDHDLSHDDSPTARASFGIYKGNEQQIYWREVY